MKPMKLDVNTLDPDAPDFEEQVEAAQAAEDAELEGRAANPDADPEQGADPDGEGSTPDSTSAAPTDAEKTNTEPEKQTRPAGVLSKDGKTVLPFAVVQSARQEKAAERQARLAAEAERDAIRQQLEDLKAGKKPASEDDDPLDAAVAEAAEDVPIVAELHKALKDTRKQLQALQGGGKTAPDNQADPEQAAREALQDDIDTVPLLAEWQAADPEKFKRAQAIDAALVGSPKWRGKTQAERFAHVAKQVADEFDLEFEDPAPQNTPTPNRADPRAAVQRATRQQPNTLSDFKNGAPDQIQGRLDRLPATSMLARMSDMTDDEIEAHLAKFG
jgi:hypothetical protein